MEWRSSKRRDNIGVNGRHATKGLCGIVILCREGWRRSSSQITSEVLVSISRVALYPYNIVLDMRTQNGDEPVGEITFLGAKLPF